MRLFLISKWLSNYIWSDKSFTNTLPSEFSSEEDSGVEDKITEDCNDKIKLLITCWNESKFEINSSRYARFSTY